MKAYTDKINHLLNTFDADTLRALDAVSTERTFSKGSYLLQAGSVCNQSYWVMSGILRKFYMHNDREVTTEFYFADDLAMSFDSYTLQQPSREYIQALADTVVSVTDRQRFERAKQSHPKLLELDLLLTEYYALLLEEKVFELHTQNATQRYEGLLQKSPHVIQHVPLTQIASYLNISLETLSRIRARI